MTRRWSSCSYTASATCLVWLAANRLAQFANAQEDTSSCNILIYSSLTDTEPQVQIDKKDTCPIGNGPRAFVQHNAAAAGGPWDYAMHGAQVALSPQLKEVGPAPHQKVRCLQGRDCGFAIRGFGVGVQDGVMVLPLGSHECPPPFDIDGNEQNADLPVVLEAERHAAVVGKPSDEMPEVSYAVFDVPERAQLAAGDHTICYASALAVQRKITDDLKASDFHYNAGILQVGKHLLDCDFEETPEPKTAVLEADIGERPLPCNFRNFRDRYFVDLVWQLQQGPTETSGTGPEGDATPGLGGKGTYVFMDSPGYALGATATLVSPPVVFSPGGYCLRFKYNMHGEDVSSLRVFLHKVEVESRHRNNGGHTELGGLRDYTQKTLLGNWGSPRWVAVGNKGAKWHAGGFEFKAAKKAVMQVAFEAVAGKSEYGDVALDDVRVSPGRCPSELRHHMPKTLGMDNQPMVCGEVRLLTGNHSEDKAWFVDGAISCAGTGYSLDNLKDAAPLPCCVPHLGVYKLTLQDLYGDGWEGSELEFRFFNRVMRFGSDGGFQHAGFDRTYDLVIGTLEIAEVRKTADTEFEVDVRVAHGNSFVWCGMVPVGKSGRPLRVDLSPNLLKTYGVRSKVPTVSDNQVVTLPIVRAALKVGEDYDLFCHSERIDAETPEPDEVLREAIHASRVRVTADAQPPQLMEVEAKSGTNSITVEFRVTEAGTVWCAAAPAGPGPSDLVFGSDGELARLLTKEMKGERLSADDRQKITNFFDTRGQGMDIEGAEHIRDAKYSIEITGLLASQEYYVYCYAEDEAAPTVNGIPLKSVFEAKMLLRTQSKVASVRILKKTTLHRGFRLHVVTDGPGTVHCAAAPADYGVPNVKEVVDVGATATVVEPGKELTVEVKGVEPNAAYTLYCVAAAPAGSFPDGSPQGYSTTADMVLSSATAVSYGRYCEEREGDEIYTLTTKKTPFHPVTAEEEMKIRNYVLSRSELGLEGLYRITLMPIKDDIYEYYERNGPFPKRFARVRAGRCVDNIGYYEQYKVGPLDSDHMTYERIAPPVETECGGYNPQGVFGRRLLAVASETDLQKFNSWLTAKFGVQHGNEECRLLLTDMLHVNVESPSSAATGAPTRRLVGREEHHHHGRCGDIGPIIIEDPNNEHKGRVWAGLKAPNGDRLPIYFLYELEGRELETEGDSTGPSWVQKIIRERRLPEDFLHVWEANKIFVDGKVYGGLSELLGAIEAGELDYLNSDVVARRRLDAVEAARMRHRRALLPDPYPGAPGTAGPLPKRLTRRGGLENRSHPEHVEAQGKRFTVTAATTEEEFTIDYAGWSFTIANDRDSSLRFYNVRFQGVRVAFEMGLMEALAHYTVSERNFFFMDTYYGGLGAAARKVHKGVECPKTSLGLFWDGSVCIFEQDDARPYRSHWKSGELRDAAPQVSLVVRQMLTVSNYDYVTDYKFLLTGMWLATVSFTGELYAGMEVPYMSARQSDYGVQVTGAMRMAALHNHVAAWRVDFDLGKDDRWKANSLLMTQIIADPNRPGAHKLSRKFADSEKEGVIRRDDLRQMVYEIVDEKWNIFGNYGGYRLHPGFGLIPQDQQFELYLGPAAWAKYRVFTTLHKYGELDASLPRDNKFAKRPAVSVDRYIADDEDIRHGDLVTWISDGVFHVPVVEDMPQTIPVGNTLGWLAKPANLWLEDPSMDLWNGMGGGVEDPGTCAVVRIDIGEAEPSLEGMWRRAAVPPAVAG